MFSAVSKSEGPALLPTPLAGDAMGVTIHRLSNGLTVYISTDRSTPSVSSWISVRSGSRHDPANSTGLAHYLEHMLFKGSGKLGTLDIAKEKPHLDRIAALYDELRDASDSDRAAIFAKIDKETQASSKYSVPNEFDNLYASLGIDGVNAFTSDEQTVYIATIPSNRFDVWTKVEGDRFTDPQFRLFYPELESVYEEKNRSLDSAQSRVFQELALALYPSHPYGTQPTIGLTEHLKTPAYGDMVKYFDAWYRPNNMAIVLAGDIDAERALPALEKAFGKLEAKPLPALPPSSLEASKTRKEVVVVAPGKQSIMLAWPTVAAGHDDEVALEAMDLVIDNSATGLLNLELVLSQKLPQAGSYSQQMRESGMWILTGTARDGQTLAEVETLLMSVVKKLKAGAFTQDDLDAIVVNREISEKRRLESNGARVQIMNDAFIEGRPWEQVVSKQERLRAVRREDVMRVAGKYLTNAPVVVKRVRGEFEAQKVEKPSITAIKIDSSKQSPYAAAIKEMPVTELEPQWLVSGEHYTEGTLPAGPAIVVDNERNDLFSLSYSFDFGERQEPLLCFAIDLIERSGAGKLPPKELQKTLYAMGTSISFSCGSRDSGVTVSGINRNMAASLAILRDWIAVPRIEAGALAKLQANTISKRKDSVNEPSVISRALSEYALFGKDSGFLKVPSNKALGSATEKKLAALVAGLPNMKHRTRYFGPRKMAELKPMISMGAKHKAGKKQVPVRYNKPKKATLFFVDQKVAQAQVRIGFPGKELAEADRVKSNLFNQYVGGGMGGLIFQEIREARGLAYSAWTYHATGNRKGDQSAVIAGLGTQADKTLDAVGTLLSLIVPLKVEESRFQTARTSLDAEFRKTRITPRSRAGTVFGWKDLGLDADPRPAEYQALQSSTAASMEEFANARTKVAPVLAISGDSARIDLKELAKIAKIVKVKTVKAAQLFGY
jgi:predicted Zn-dependent peptidase